MLNSAKCNRKACSLLGKVFGNPLFAVQCMGSRAPAIRRTVSYLRRSLFPNLCIYAYMQMRFIRVDVYSARKCSPDYSKLTFFYLMFKGDMCNCSKEQKSCFCIWKRQRNSETTSAYVYNLRQQSVRNLITKVLRMLHFERKINMSNGTRFTNTELQRVYKRDDFKTRTFANGNNSSVKWAKSWSS